MAQTEPNTLLLLVRCNPELTEQDVKDTIEIALKQCGINSDVSVREVSIDTINEVDRIVRGLRPVVQGSEQLWLTRRPGKSAVWNFQLLPVPSDRIIISLKVYYAKNATALQNTDTEEIEYTPVTLEQLPKKGDESVGLAVISHRNGRYEFYPELARVPVRYEMKLQNAAGSEEKIEGTFPLIDRAFLIQLRPFVGNKHQLFSTVTDKNKVANPFNEIKEESSVQLVFGSIKALTGVVGETIENLNLVVTVPSVPYRTPKRVWMLFPLDKKQADEEAIKLRQLDPAKYGEYIRQNKAEQEVVLDLKSPKWFELPKDNEVFRAQIPLVQKREDFSSLSRRYPEVYRILVWEFEADMIRRPIKVENENFKLEKLETWSQMLGTAHRGN